MARFTPSRYRQETAHRPQLKICFGSLRSRGFGERNAATSYPLRDQRKSSSADTLADIAFTKLNLD